MAKKSDDPPPRRNRLIGISEAIGSLLDPALKKRGFATRDLLAYWPTIAPKPYDTVAIPDRLSWPRGEKRAGGATLFVRCRPGYGLALAHEAPKLAAAINRYFGYVLVAQVRLAVDPLADPLPVAPPPAPDPAAIAAVASAVQAVTDPEVQDALRRLGEGLTRRR